jgi:hypothetical protein
MAKIRGIKPEFWTDDSLVELSVAARLFFIGLWTFSDDNGVFEWDREHFQNEFLITNQAFDK